MILEVTVAGRIIGTTAEHPFYAYGKGWTAAGSLVVGDLLATAQGQWVPVEWLHYTGTLETVYNFRVADHHTYFVGDADWGFSVWAHNQYSTNRAAMAVDEAIENSELSIKTPRDAAHFDGRTGKPSTQILNLALMQELKSRGWTIRYGAAPGFKEEFIPGPGGGRFLSSSPDITATKLIRGKERTLRINTATVDAYGRLIDNELSQALRIRYYGSIKDQARPAHLLLIPKR